MHQSPQNGCAASVEIERDRQLLRAIDSGAEAFGFRTWEVAAPVVVLGRSNAAGEHVLEDACRADGVSIIRRFSGGGTVVLGPGCLNYAVAVSLAARPDLRDVAASFMTILGAVVAALAVDGLAIKGGTDVVMNERKISGNAQCRGRDSLLHHGTVLYDFDAGLAARYLCEPRRRPEYRGSRRHRAFLTNIPLTGKEVASRLTVAMQRLSFPA